MCSQAPGLEAPGRKGTVREGRASQNSRCLPVYISNLSRTQPRSCAGSVLSTDRVTQPSVSRSEDSLLSPLDVTAMSRRYERFLARPLNACASPGVNQKFQGRAWSTRAEEAANWMVPLAQETLGRRKGTRRLSVSGDGLSGPSLSSPQHRLSERTGTHQGLGNTDPGAHCWG